MPSRRNDILIDDAEIRSRNFSGKEGRYNVKGKRNFLLLLTPEQAADFDQRGFRVKLFNEREEEPGVQQAFVKVNVNYNSEWPPQLFLVTSKGKTLLSEDDLQVLDWSQITKADIVINPSVWTPPEGGEATTTAYLQKGYFTIYEDELDRRYAEVADSALGSVSEPNVIDADDLL